MNKREDWLDYYADAFDDEEANAQVRRSIEERDKLRSEEQHRSKSKQTLKIFYRVVKELLSLIGGIWVVIQLLKFLCVI